MEEYKESILFSKVSCMSKKKNNLKKIDGGRALGMSVPHSQSSPWNWFFFICTMDFPGKKGLFIVWKLGQNKLKGLNLKEP